MKVYLVTYEDTYATTAEYGVAGVFSTRDQANRFIKDSPYVSELYTITATRLDKPGTELSVLSMYEDY